MRWLLAFVIICAFGIIGQAQEAPVGFRLLMDSTELHTGQPYTVSLRIDATDIWAFSVKIDYDPGLLYIIGAQGGQPIKPSPLLNDIEGMTVFNRAQNNRLEYVYSRLAPAESGSYNDTVATFQIYPLSAGTMTLKVSSAEASRLSFKVDGGQRVIDTQSSLPVAANELTLTITGEIVSPPLEATATPIPQLTPTAEFVGSDISLQPTISAPTPIPLINDVPTSIPQLASAQTVSESSGDTMPLLVLAIGLIVVAVIGLLSLWRSSRRR